MKIQKVLSSEGGMHCINTYGSFLIQFLAYLDVNRFNVGTFEQDFKRHIVHLPNHLFNRYLSICYQIVPITLEIILYFQIGNIRI